MADYPFPGCCEHTTNAHSRRHCLLCDCEKSPVQVAPAPPPSWAPEDVDTTNVRPCEVCHALTLAEDAEQHAEWHDRQLITLENLAAALSGLRHRTAPPHPEGESPK